MESSSMGRPELVAFAESRGGQLLSGEDNALQDAHQDVHQDAHQDVHQDVHQDAHQDAHQDVHQDAHQYALRDVLRWRCALNHEFEASPRLLIQGGYWCPECFPSAHEGRGWDWVSQAKVDPLLARFYRTG